MKHLILGVVVVMLGIATMALAQDPGPGGPGPGGFNQQAGPFPEGGFGGGRGGRGGPGGFSDGRGRGGRGNMRLDGPDLGKYELLRGYIEVVDRYTQMTRSADSAGVAAVISASDILRQSGPQGAIDFLSKTLPDVKIPAVERAIRIQLADLYRQVGQSDKALEQLSVLMKASN